MLALNVSDRTGPSSGAFCTSCIRRFGMRYYSAYYHIPNLRIQLVQDAPDDGPVKSETCRANVSAEKTHSLKQFVYLVGLHIY